MAVKEKAYRLEVVFNTFVQGNKQSAIRVQINDETREVFSFLGRKIVSPYRSNSDDYQNFKQVILRAAVSKLSEEQVAELLESLNNTLYINVAVRPVEGEIQPWSVLTMNKDSIGNYNLTRLGGIDG